MASPSNAGTIPTMGLRSRTLAAWGLAWGFALLAFSGASCGLDTHGDLDEPASVVDASSGGSIAQPDSSPDQSAPKGGYAGTGGSLGKGGAGASSGAAGSIAQGGAPGAGGSIAQGGATGAGGTSGSTGQGGATSTGGASGLGGAPGTGGATGGSGGTVLAACNITSQNYPCANCFQTYCATNCGTCSTNPECLALIECFNNQACWDPYADCWNDACVAQCKVAHAAGLADYDAFRTCAQTTCQATCGGPSPSCGGAAGAGSGGGPPCASLGSTCSTHSECCNKYCCQTYSQGTCHKQNQAGCTSDGECCTGHCKNGYCDY